MGTAVEGVSGMLRDGHIYIFRKNEEPVWLGYKEHIEALEPEQTVLLIRYRLAFDRRCCKRVN